jgi:hypothetical protein
MNNGQKFFASFFQKRSACLPTRPQESKRFFFEKKKQKTFITL